MDAISELENALGADLLRAGLLGGARPKIAGRYIVERFLGRGATGLVVAALDDRLGRPVALKLGIAAADTTMLAEARALALLDHPNVVRVHDVDFGNAVFDGKPFRLWLVSMQRVEGRNLRVWLKEQPRSQQEIVQVFVDAGRGLVAAHAAKIVHRDFKPDNVIVRNDGVAQVLDFGFAVPAASTHSDARNVQRDSAGTEPYMAPEARVGRATRRSDQFSFGVSLVEAFTGEPRPATRRAPRGMPRALWTVLRRATAQDASRRFPEMSSLLEALARKPRTSIWQPVLVVAVATAATAWFVFSEQRDVLLEWSTRFWAATTTSADALSDAGVGAERGDAGLLDGGVDASAMMAARDVDAAQPHVDVVSADEHVDVGAPDAGLACPSLGRERRFYTTSGALRGCYVMTVKRQRGCVVAASIDKIASGDAVVPCRIRTSGTLSDSDVRFVIDPAGSTEVDMELRHPRASRDYRFFFTLASGRLDGRFEVRGPGETGLADDTGTISEDP